jgi:hypothetical protein
METNYWTQQGAAIRHGFIHTASSGENYWTRQQHAVWFIRAQADMRAREHAIRVRKVY